MQLDTYGISYWKVTKKFRVNAFPFLGILIGLGKRGQFFLSDFGPVYGRWKVPGDQDQAPDDQDQVPIDHDKAPDDQDQPGELDTPDEVDESEDSISVVDSPKQLPFTQDEKVWNSVLIQESFNTCIWCQLFAIN